MVRFVQKGVVANIERLNLGSSNCFLLFKYNLLYIAFLFIASKVLYNPFLLTNSDIPNNV